jgi:serine/threonine protein kinase
MSGVPTEFKALFEQITKYTFVKVLGKGAIGTVFLVQNENGDKLAMKVTSPRQFDKEFDEKWKKEVDLLSKLKQNTPEVTLNIMDNFIINATKLYYVTVIEFLDNSTTLDSFMINFNSIEIVQTITEILLRKLFLLHTRAGIAHGDIKPENILLKLNRFTVADAFIIDFGEACDVSDNCLFTGTKTYWSPERWGYKTYRYNLNQLKQFDIWALGVTLFQVSSYGVMPYPILKERNYDLKSPVANVPETSRRTSFLPSRRPSVVPVNDNYRRNSVFSDSRRPSLSINSRRSSVSSNSRRSSVNEEDVEYSNTSLDSDYNDSDGSLQSIASTASNTKNPFAFNLKVQTRNLYAQNELQESSLGPHLNIYFNESAEAVSKKHQESYPYAIDSQIEKTNTIYTFSPVIDIMLSKQPENRPDIEYLLKMFYRMTNGSYVINEEKMLGYKVSKELTLPELLQTLDVQFNLISFSENNHVLEIFEIVLYEFCGLEQENQNAQNEIVNFNSKYGCKSGNDTLNNLKAIYTSLVELKSNLKCNTGNNCPEDYKLLILILAYTYPDITEPISTKFQISEIDLLVSRCYFDNLFIFNCNEGISYDIGTSAGFEYLVSVLENIKHI